MVTSGVGFLEGMLELHMMKTVKATQDKMEEMHGNIKQLQENQKLMLAEVMNAISKLDARLQEQETHGLGEQSYI